MFPLNVNTPLITSFRGDVSANNMIGRGPSCPIQREVGEYIHHDLHYLIRSINSINIATSDLRNQVFTLYISSTNPTNQTVECTPQTGTIGTFDCEFCYNPPSTCRSTTFNFCQVITESLSLSSLNEMTYCYRATARINGTSVNCCGTMKLQYW